MFSLGDCVVVACDIMTGKELSVPYGAIGYVYNNNSSSNVYMVTFKDGPTIHCGHNEIVSLEDWFLMA